MSLLLIDWEADCSRSAAGRGDHAGEDRRAARAVCGRDGASLRANEAAAWRQQGNSIRNHVDGSSSNLQCCWVFLIAKCIWKHWLHTLRTDSSKMRHAVLYDSALPASSLLFHHRDPSNFTVFYRTKFCTHSFIKSQIVIVDRTVTPTVRWAAALKEAHTAAEYTHAERGVIYGEVLHSHSGVNEKSQRSSL